MGDVFTPLDLVIFFTALIGVMAVGLIAGRKENTSEDYFLAGRNIPWWGVAGSIFGSNVSANHMVGMMGIGFSIGFAQSHFELGAIFGLMVLCYGFLPVYRKLKLFTLSEYLGRRYDERSRLAYAIIMILIMVVVQMVPGIYIGARSICVLIGGDAMETVAEVQTEGNVAAGGEATNDTVQKRKVNQTYYNVFVIALAVIAAAYTVFGGLKAVIWTDVIQSALLLAAGIGVALLTFQKIGGWEEMMALDLAGAHKMRLYRPMNDPDLPWTGVFTGLMAMHCFYWGTNQFIVQRALGARSDAEARLGIVAAGFLKLLIPFFAIGTGVAAYYLFQSENLDVAPDAAFPELVKLVIPIGSGIIGLISAGLIGAILSSIDSMMNSAATIVSFDIYKKYINPAATDRNMILVGRVSIILFVTLAASLAILVLNPNSNQNFFLQIVDYSSYLTPGLLVAFFMGMFWRRGTGTGAIVTMLAGILFSGAVQFGYDNLLGTYPAVSDVFGSKLNFFHRALIVILLCMLVHVVVSLKGQPDAEKSRLVWTDLGGHSSGDVRNLLTAFLISLVFFAILGWSMYSEWLNPQTCAALGAIWTFLIFTGMILRALMKRQADRERGVDLNLLVAVLREDRFWAGILCALAVFMHYYFY
jgi:SSS family solute:Na+ symporter